MTTFTTTFDCGLLGELEADVTYKYIRKGFRGSREEPSETGVIEIESAVVDIDGTKAKLNGSQWDLNDLFGDACHEHYWGDDQ